MSGRRAVATLLCGCVGIAGSTDAFALLSSCSVAAVPVNFSIYNPLAGTPDDATGTVTVQCDVFLIGLFTSWTITLGTGSGNYSARLMQSGAASLSYNLYTSAAHSTVWGDGSGGTGVISDGQTLIVGTNSTNYPVYGRIPAGQDKAAGTYMDTITVTVNY